MTYRVHPFPPFLCPIPHLVKDGEVKGREPGLLQIRYLICGSFWKLSQKCSIWPGQISFLLLLSLSKLVQRVCNRNKGKQKRTAPSTCQIKKVNWFLYLWNKQLAGRLFLLLSLFKNRCTLWTQREVFGWINIKHNSVHDNESSKHLLSTLVLGVVLNDSCSLFYLVLKTMITTTSPSYLLIKLANPLLSSLHSLFVLDLVVHYFLNALGEPKQPFLLTQKIKRIIHFLYLRNGTTERQQGFTINVWSTNSNRRIARAGKSGPFLWSIQPLIICSNFNLCYSS